MRANEFLFEHKKGVLARKYATKPRATVNPSTAFAKQKAKVNNITAVSEETALGNVYKQIAPAWAGGNPPKPAVSKPVPVAKGAADVTATSTPLETQQPLGSFLEKAAKAAGITGVELAQLLAQCRTETIAFTKLIEQPNKWMKTYEPVFKKDPKTGKVVDVNPHSRDTLGNTKKGDGQKFIGRGYIQITGRKNYTNFAADSKMDVVNHPELLEDPTNAAQAAIHYWTSRVRPRVSDFKDTAAVTRLVAGKAMKHLDIRFANFKNYLTKLFSVMPKLPALPVPKPKKATPAKKAAPAKGVKKAEVDTMDPDATQVAVAEPDDNTGLAEGWLYTKFQNGH
jgi:predicted chitinase